MKRITLLLFLALSGLPTVAQNVTVDPTFNQGNTGTKNGSLYSAVQPDGKIIIAGGILNYNGVSNVGIARLNQDGTLDTSFKTGTGPSDGTNATSITCIVIQPDGKILIGGSFTSFSGKPANLIARLNIDGSLDSSFNTSRVFIDKTYDEDGIIWCLNLLPDGTILAGGNFRAGLGGDYFFSFAALKPNGSLDISYLEKRTSYEVDQTTFIQDIAILPDGNFLLAGFSPTQGTTGLAKINRDGSIDDSFENAIKFNGYARTIYALPNNEFLIGGLFYTTNNDVRTYFIMTKIDSNGNMLNDFHRFDYNTNANVNGVFVKSICKYNGKFLVGGSFTQAGGAAINNLALLNNDGSADTSFTTGTGPDYGVNSVNLQDGKIIISGGFSNFNNTGQWRITRLNTANLGFNDIVKGDNFVAYKADNKFSFKSDKEIESISVYDISGRIAYKALAISNTIYNLDYNLPSGIYIAKVTFIDKSVKTVKLL